MCQEKHLKKHLAWASSYLSKSDSTTAESESHSKTAPESSDASFFNLLSSLYCCLTLCIWSAYSISSLSAPIHGESAGGRDTDSAAASAAAAAALGGLSVEHSGASIRKEWETGGREDAPAARRQSEWKWRCCSDRDAGRRWWHQQQQAAMRQSDAAQGRGGEGGEEGGRGPGLGPKRQTWIQTTPQVL